MSEPAIPMLARVLHVSTTALKASTPDNAAVRLASRFAEIMPVQRAVVVARNGKIVAVDSGVDEVRRSEFAHSAKKMAKRQRNNNNSQQLPAEGSKADPRTEAQRQAMQGSTVLWLPLLRTPNGQWQYALWLERWQAQTFQDEEISLLERLTPIFAASLQPAVDRPHPYRKRLLLAAVAVIAIACVPVRQSVIGRAEVKALHPQLVFAPLEGVVDEVLVKPGQWVESGTALFTFDTRVLDQRLNESRKAVEVARAELVRLEAASHLDSEARASLPVQRLRVEQAQKQAIYAQQLRLAAEVKADRAGTAIVSEPEKLKGAPVQLGQQILSIAHPGQTHVQIHIPVRDVGLFATNAAAELRLDASPFDIINAKVKRIGQTVIVDEQQQATVLVEAIWQQPPDKVLPGQRGSARLYGESTILAWQLARKPLMALLGWLGW